MVALKVEKMGETLGVVLSEDARQLLDAKVGDVLYLDAGANGDLVLTKQAPSLEDRREHGRAILKRYRATFEALAK